MRSEPILALVCAVMGGVLWGVGFLVPSDSRSTETASVCSSDKRRLYLGVLSHQGGNQSKTSPIRSEERAVLDQKESSQSCRLVKMKVTAYCLCEKCCGVWSQQKVQRTSTGKVANVFDGVAADPKLLPYRTQLDIPGVGIKEVDDTGGAMRQDAKLGIYHIDVRMASHQEALRFGVKWLAVLVLSK